MHSLYSPSPSLLPQAFTAGDSPTSFGHAPDSRFVIPIGSIVNDCHWRPIPGQPPNGSKTTCTMEPTLGGAVVNVAHSAIQFGATVRPICLRGGDATGIEANGRLQREFPLGFSEVAYEQTRTSVIFPDGKLYTTRPPLKRTTISEPVRAALSTCSWAVVCPFAAADHDLVVSALGAAPRSVLLLSKEQLALREMALDLAVRASLLVLNRDEAQVLTGESEPRLAIEKLRAAGCRQVIVTSVEGVEALLSGEFISRPSYRIGDVKNTVGAGDTFTGALIAAWSVGAGVVEGLDLALAAAARHVGGLSPAGVQELEQWRASQTRVVTVGSPASNVADNGLHPSSCATRATTLSTKSALSNDRRVLAGLGVGVAASLLLAAISFFAS